MVRIEILGSGCPKCKALAANAEAAAKALGLQYEIIKVTDLKEISRRGVMMTPALAVNGTIKSTGRVLTPEEIKPLLQD